MTQVDRLHAEGITGHGIRIRVSDIGIDHKHSASETAANNTVLSALVPSYSRKPMSSGRRRTRRPSANTTKIFGSRTPGRAFPRINEDFSHAFYLNLRAIFYELNQAIRGRYICTTRYLQASGESIGDQRWRFHTAEYKRLETAFQYRVCLILWTT